MHEITCEIGISNFMVFCMYIAIAIAIMKYRSMDKSPQSLIKVSWTSHPMNFQVFIHEKHCMDDSYNYNFYIVMVV